MCCGLENLKMDSSSDVKKLISSVVRKKRFNRNRRHPSMCVDAVLTSTINLLKDEQLIEQILQSKCVKRPSPFSSSRPRRKKSRWDMKTREPRSYEIDQELDELTGMNGFFQKLKAVSYETRKIGNFVIGKDDNMAANASIEENCLSSYNL